MMNQFDNSTSGACANQVPLFASSWVALFFVIRHSLAGRRVDEAPAAQPSNPEYLRTRH